ncbi:MAG: transcriptional regulator [Candidatus Bathyarchaeota archaeon]|jgi:putative transcriptional regulator|nr:transcriptional regulator [Candidatus Bathyarchaeota archaeon]
MLSNDSVTEMLAKRVAGEIVLAQNPGVTMRKWRSLLQVNQVEMAQELRLSPSVISDYETGRRRSPGSAFIKRFVRALLEIDNRKGGRYVQQMSRIALTPGDVFRDIREFVAPVKIGEICTALDCEVLVGKGSFEQEVYGYTVIDSLKAIKTLSGLDFYRIFGTTSERALIFIGVSHGRSPMIAVKISPFKPRIIILHGAKEDIDPLAIVLARSEGIPLAISRLESEDALVQSLLDLYRGTQE